ncbi:MAG: S41 family peptidase [Patescibacteria group bacterium]|nr:S41 family peptidase [Patescibacteria group bacterium]
MKAKTIFKPIVFLAIVLAIGFLGYRAGILVEQSRLMKTPPANVIGSDLDKPNNVNFAIFWEAWRQLEKNFIGQDKIDYQKMVYGAVDGMTKSLGDPYTSFFTPQQTTNFNEELSGRYEGVGMYVGIKDGQLTVISPLKGTPAEKAGLKAGDAILKIDGVDTKDMTVEEAVSKIKGERGTEVTLSIVRGDWQAARDFALKRELIEIPTLEWEKKGDDIALIKIYQFNEILPGEFVKTSNEILRSGAKRIIIDLRNNPGGYLEVAQNIAGWFVKNNEVVVWQDMGENQARKPHYANGNGAFMGYPAVVLINEGSASAAEILAGCLRDLRGVQLIGEKSFGKGSVQEQINLSDKSSLKITIAKWLTPKGNLIDKEGLAPDIEVAATSTATLEDAQLEKAIDVVKNLNL